MMLIGIELNRKKIDGINYYSIRPVVQSHRPELVKAIIASVVTVAFFIISIKML